MFILLYVFIEYIWIWSCLLFFGKNGYKLKCFYYVYGYYKSIVYKSNIYKIKFNLIIGECLFLFLF